MRLKEKAQSMLDPKVSNYAKKKELCSKENAMESEKKVSFLKVRGLKTAYIG